MKKSNFCIDYYFTIMTPSKRSHGLGCDSNRHREQTTRLLLHDSNVKVKGKAGEEMAEHKEREGDIIDQDHTVQHNSAAAA